MPAELKRLQMRLNNPIFSFWNRQKNFVPERRDLCPCRPARLRVSTNWIICWSAHSFFRGNGRLYRLAATTVC